MIPDKKICGVCGIEKGKECFQVRRKPKGYCWLRLECKSCQNDIRKKRYSESEEIRKRKGDQSKAWAAKNRESRLAYYRKYEIENKDRKRENYKKRYERDKEKIKSERKKYYRKNPQRHIAIVTKYAKNNIDSVRARQRKRHHIRKKEDIEYVIKRKLRGRINAALKVKGGAKKAARTASLTGCSIQFLIEYLEAGFLPGMGWHNYTFDGWHIDHIIPCAKFDLKDPEQQKICFHYTNLQPMWGSDNVKKGAKMEEPDYTTLTNKNIMYELMECLATTNCVTYKIQEKKADRLDIVAMELMKERLNTLYNHFSELYKTEQERIDKDLNNLLN